MIPHVIVLEPGLGIFKIYNGYRFFGRPTIEELWQDLRAVLKKCRPDWDITGPELKAAWEQGERDRFCPYGKTYGRVFREQSNRRQGSFYPFRGRFLAHRVFASCSSVASAFHDRIHFLARYVKLELQRRAILIA